MTTSANFGLPYIASQQNQPEVTHNTALNMLQAIQAGALTRGANSAPGSPTEGDVHIVGTAPTGAWANRANCIAAWLSSQWVFLPGNDSSGTPITMGAAQEGLRIYSIADQAEFIWTDDAASPATFEWRERVIQAIPAQDYGQLNISNNTTPLALTAAVDVTLKTNTDYTQITGIWDAIPHGENNGVTQQTNSFTVAADGVYRIEFWANASSDINNTKLAVKFAVDGTIGLVRRPAARLVTSGIFYNMAAHGFVQLNAGQVVTLYNAADKTCNITWEDVVFSINEMRRI